MRKFHYLEGDSKRAVFVSGKTPQAASDSADQDDKLLQLLLAFVSHPPARFIQLDRTAETV